MSLPRVAIVCSRYNASITDPLRVGAVKAYVARGGKKADAEVVPAPGSFELVALSHAAALTGRYAGIVAIGCIIKGDTAHDQHLATAVANGLVQVGVLTGIPITFGVLTVNDAQQARERAGGSKGNKGEEAMTALLDTLAEMDVLAAKQREDEQEALDHERRRVSGRRPDKAAAPGRDSKRPLPRGRFGRGTR